MVKTIAIGSSNLFNKTSGVDTWFAFLKIFMEWSFLVVDLDPSQWVTEVTATKSTKRNAKNTTSGTKRTKPNNQYVNVLDDDLQCCQQLSLNDTNRDNNK